jgi:hypothetical protein
MSSVNSLFCFLSNLDVSLEFVSEHIESLGTSIGNSMVSSAIWI